MPIVTNPKQKQEKKKHDRTFVWDMEEVVDYYSSKVIVGDSPFSSNVYPGRERTRAQGPKDTTVDHYRGNGQRLTLFTMPCFKKKQGGTWYTLGSDPIYFYSVP
jgi:hypothetical protein